MSDPTPVFLTTICCTLGGVNLPYQFRYKPFIPKKRVTTTQTARGVVVQAATPQIVFGDDLLSWTIEGCTPCEFNTLWDLYYTTSLTVHPFVGYWGEQLYVLFSTFDSPSVQSRIFSCSGSFQVLAATALYDARCMPGVVC